MRGIGIRNTQPLRPSDRASSRADGGGDANGFQRDVPGDGGRALRSGVARLAGLVSESEGAQPDRQALFRGRERPSGERLADGRLVGPLGGTGRECRVGFGAPVPPGGYAWWYVDGLSDDGLYGITLIAFTGSVFSPYYAWSGRRDPDNHCALNVALYGRSGHRWAMTERGRKAVERGAWSFRVGPSALSWDGDALTVSIDEVTVPIPRRIRGVVRLHPRAITGRRFELDPAGRHRWWPISPCSRIEVELERPALSWSGSGYFDTNDGDEPLEAGFRYWNWSRASFGDAERAALLYDVIDKQGQRRNLALRADASGRIEEAEPPAEVALPRTLWLMKRVTRADDGGGASVRSTLEDSPFYARSLLRARLFGEEGPAMHESLSLQRFDTQIVKQMLPYRMPRWWF